MPKLVASHLVSWASDIEPNTLEQAERTSRLPVIPPGEYVALMPDAHLGYGATVGSVIPTEGAIIPSAVGVDIGCGMIAAQLDMAAHQLPDDLGNFIPALEKVVPAGLGKWHQDPTEAALHWWRGHCHELPARLEKRALEQFGTLGSGNHFFEICLDEDAQVWLVLHSGSRGVGNQLATIHINNAKKLPIAAGLEDPDLAWFVQGTAEFDAYISDLLWAQEYAASNRWAMMYSAAKAFESFVEQPVRSVSMVNCHHNYAVQEHHHGRDLWITRKGAIRAGVGDRGVIPGSMGSSTFIVSGLGSTDSYESCSHGAGRRLSRNQARKQLTADSLANSMGGTVWQHDSAEALLDEHPAAYKDIGQVMADQADLVRIEHTLHQVLNYKGTDGGRRKHR